ncbi:MAG TPA: head-tail connector protein [Mesorhizobium sp.]|jgi:uncharacterized phage protein (predicted DNA packaging)|nr:head-tail connector protein [Mesorhizobium sp.]
MITVADLKAHLNLDHAEDDDLLTKKIAAAQAWTYAYVANPDAPLSPAYDEAVLRFAASLYENREDGDVPLGVLELLQPLRSWCF